MLPMERVLVDCWVSRLEVRDLCRRWDKVSSRPASASNEGWSGIFKSKARAERESDEPALWVRLRPPVRLREPPWPYGSKGEVGVGTRTSRYAEAEAFFKFSRILSYLPQPPPRPPSPSLLGPDSDLDLV